LRVPILEVAKIWKIPFLGTISNVLKFDIVSNLKVSRNLKISEILKIIQFLMIFTAPGEVSRFNSFECESFKM